MLWMRGLVVLKSVEWSGDMLIGCEDCFWVYSLLGERVMRRRIDIERWVLS